MLKRLAPLIATVVATTMFAPPASAQVIPEPIPGIYGPAVRRGITFYLRYSMTAGAAEDQFAFGDPGDTPLLCDWDGSGFRQLGVHRGFTFYLETSTQVLVIPFGNTGDQPICGDWDGDGVETIGVRRGNRWFLSDGAAPGATTNHDLFYGDVDDTAFVGDFDGSGTATPGVRRGIRFYLKTNNEPASAATHSPFDYGAAGDVPVAADWDGGDNPAETVGVFRAGTWFYRTDNAAGPATGQFLYGSPGDRPLIYREDA
jgi:hypothetical protein